MTLENPVVAFARDFSGNDPVIMARVAEFVADPPRTLEVIGFYGAEDYPEQSRLYLATVSLLADSGKLSSVEDKYTYELLFHWRDTGVIEVESLPETAKAMFGPILDENLEWNEQQINAYRKVSWKIYAEATNELEEYLALRGKVLLSIDATGGDTMFFALVDPRIAERWRDRALAEHDGYRAGVRSPMWDVFWSHLSYAYRSLLVDDYEAGYPPDTQVRSNAIPFAQ